MVGYYTSESKNLFNMLGELETKKEVGGRDRVVGGSSICGVVFN